MATTPIAEDVCTLSEDPTLIGGRCTGCGAYVFPLRQGCPRCGAPAVEREELGGRGTLWSWTSQEFPPRPPFRGEFGASGDGFQPWYVGVVEIAGKLRVESLLVGCTEETIEFGMPLRLVVTPFRADEQTGDEIVTFAFAPEEPAGARAETE